MLGDALLPLPLSPNGLTLRGLDLRTDLCYRSFSVRMFFAQWMGRVGVWVRRFTCLVPFNYVTASHLIVWDRWVLLPLGFIGLRTCMVLHANLSLLGLELRPSTPSFRPSWWSRQSLPCLMSHASGVHPGCMVPSHVLVVCVVSRVRDKAAHNCDCDCHT